MHLEVLTVAFMLYLCRNAAVLQIPQQKVYSLNEPYTLFTVFYLQVKRSPSFRHRNSDYAANLLQLTKIASCN